MKRLSFWQTVLLVFVGTSMASSITILPVRGTEDAVRVSNLEFSYGDRNYKLGDNFKNIVGLTGLAIGTGVVGYHLSKAHRETGTNSLPYLNEKVALLEHISPKLRRELLRLVNRKTANRLLAGTFNNHVGRSPNWVAEKVIYDLKRDRRN